MIENIYILIAVLTGLVVWTGVARNHNDLWFLFATTVLSIVASVMWPLTWCVVTIYIFQEGKPNVS
jgi:hypothetical protein